MKLARTLAALVVLVLVLDPQPTRGLGLGAQRHRLLHRTRSLVQTNNNIDVPFGSENAKLADSKVGEVWNGTSVLRLTDVPSSKSGPATLTFAANKEDKYVQAKDPTNAQNWIKVKIDDTVKSCYIATIGPYAETPTGAPQYAISGKDLTKGAVQICISLGATEHAFLHDGATFKLESTEVIAKTVESFTKGRPYYQGLGFGPCKDAAAPFNAPVDTRKYCTSLEALHTATFEQLDAAGCAEYKKVFPKDDQNVAAGCPTRNIGECFSHFRKSAPAKALAIYKSYMQCPKNHLDIDKAAVASCPFALANQYVEAVGTYCRDAKAPATISKPQSLIKVCPTNTAAKVQVKKAGDSCTESDECGTKYVCAPFKGGASACCVEAGKNPRDAPGHDQKTPANSCCSGKESPYQPKCR